MLTEDCGNNLVNGNHHSHFERVLKNGNSCLRVIDIDSDTDSDSDTNTTPMVNHY